MINNKKVIAIIPARGGSKRLPKKNIKNFLGYPLLTWTIRAALESKFIDKVILSSENESILKIAKSYGCEVPLKRPRNLAHDNSETFEVIKYILDKMDKDFFYIILLQPTSPLRTNKDIDNCIKEKKKKKSISCVSAFKFHKSLNIFIEKKSNKIENIFSDKKKFNEYYVLNGAIYLTDKYTLIKNKGFISDDTLLFEMPFSKSIDIDTIDDFEVAEFFGKKLNIKFKS